MAVGVSVLCAGQLSMTTTASAAPDVDDIASVSTNLGGHPVWAHFNDPATDVAGRGPEDRTILNELVRLIDATPSGGTIQGAIHSITGGTVGSGCSPPRPAG